MPDGSAGAAGADIPAGKGQRVTAVQQIYAELRAQIVDLVLPPGASISKKDIADRFGVSQTPVREALILLEEEGLVDIFPQSRTVVSYIDVQSAREAHVLRRSVEVEIARILAGKITEIELIDLRAILQRQNAFLKSGDLAAFSAADNDLHRRMYELADLAGLWDIVRARRAHLDRLRNLHLPSKGKARSILREHRRIIDCLELKDPDAAERAVREHLRGTVSATGEIRAHFPEYFG
ncbi:GntR family transcriptional regulator [Nisaea acidiphila]|uniref:GntR family transcriptional regulator n=1 Tax=Nisaea acidiphila TaxID=1862145 RepID=A0A9J7ANT8_9PROT|nr:GntR family transcriptional regulator [Nisaea acidiphila]UUX48871.1 GntR family transcriptional regulator [Nisaea acidiphila]